MTLKSARFLPSLKRAAGQVVKSTTPGERILGKLFPNARGTGYPGGWSADRMNQVSHGVDWVYISYHTICMKLASVMPNMAWVTDANTHVPGKTVKACERSLFNSSRGGGMGGTTHVSTTQPQTTIVTPNGMEKGRYGQPEGGQWMDYGGVSPKWFDQPADRMVYGGSSFLTMGEYRSKALSVVKPHEELEPLPSGHLLRQLIENPNPVDTHFDYRYELLMFKLLCGVAYEWVIPNSFGAPCERWVLPSHWVWPRTGSGQYVDPDHPDADRLIQYYEVRPWGGLGSAGMLRLPPDQVVQHLFKSPINKLDGYSKLWAMKTWIDTEESISNARWSQMSNRALPEFWIEMGPGFVDPDDNMIARWEAKVAAKHQGEFNTGKPLWMPAGAKANVLSFSPIEMAYKDSMEQVRDTELAAFGLSRASVGLVDGMTFGSVLGTLMGDCERCFNPLLVQEGQVETKHLASRFDEEAPAWSTLTAGGHGGSRESSTRRCKLWYDNLTPADPAQVNSDLTTDLQGYAVTPNEIRVLRGRKPYGIGGDNPIVSGPGGLMPMPINVEEKADDLTELVRSYSEAMAADKDATKLGTMASNEDLPKDEVDDVDATVARVGGGGGAGGTITGDDPGDVADLASGGEVDEPNGKPSKGLVRKAQVSVNAETVRVGDTVRLGPSDPWTVVEAVETPTPGHVRITLSDGTNHVLPRGKVLWFKTGDAKAKKKGWIGVDLDGTLAHYEGFEGPDIIGDPVPAMVDRVLGWLVEGIEVRIFTARVADDPGDVAREAIRGWCVEHLGRELPITNIKDREMEELWDDRAIRVAVNSGQRVKGIAFDTVQAAGKWLAGKWQQLEARYSRAGALAMATAMIATSPLPGNIALVIAAAEGIRGIAGRKGVTKSSEDYEDGLAVGENDAVDDVSRDRPYNLRMPGSYRDRGQDFERGWRDGYGAYMRRVNYRGARHKQFDQWCKAWAKDYAGHSYSSTQFNLEGAALNHVQALQAQVDDADLVGKGKEDVPHVTVRYGLEGSDAGPVRELVETYGEASMVLGRVDYFPSDEHDVVILRVESNDLQRLNEVLDQLPNVQTHPEYQPHVTLAYVKPGMGEAYVELFTKLSEDEQNTDELEVVGTELVFSPKEGTPTMIPIASYAAQEAGKLKQIKSGPLAKLPTSDRFRGVTKALTEAEIRGNAEREWRELLGV